MSNTSEENVLKQVTLGLTEVKEGVNELLSDPIHGMLLLSFNNDMDRLINRFAFLAGHEVQPSAKEEFPPVTNFFGEDIEVRKEVPAEAFTPSQANKEAFLSKLEKLQSDIMEVEPETILNSYPLKEDQLVIRGVAKRAGLPDYEERPITRAFIQEIREALELKAEDAERQRLIDEENKDKGTGGVAEGADGVTDDEDNGNTNGSANGAGTTNNGGAEPPAVKPLSKWNKAELQAELNRLNIQFDPEATNKVLAEMVERELLNEASLKSLKVEDPS